MTFNELKLAIAIQKAHLSDLTTNLIFGEPG